MTVGADRQIRPYVRNGDLTLMARPLRADTPIRPYVRNGDLTWMARPLRTDTPIRPYGGNGDLTWMARPLRADTPLRREWGFNMDGTPPAGGHKIRPCIPSWDEQMDTLSPPDGCADSPLRKLRFRYTYLPLRAELSYGAPKAMLWAAKSYALEGRKDSSAEACCIFLIINNLHFCLRHGEIRFR